MEKLPWRKRAANLMSRHIDIKTGVIINETFGMHVEVLRERIEILDATGHPSNLYPSNLTLFMRYFNLPFEMKDAIRHYLKTNEFDASLAKPPLAIICEVDNTHILNIAEVDEDEYWENYPDRQELKIVLSPRATPTEIKHFIQENADFIKRKQAKYQHKQIRQLTANKRNSDYVKQRKSGKGFSEIAKNAPIPTNHAEVCIAYNREVRRQEPNLPIK